MQVSVQRACAAAIVGKETRASDCQDKCLHDHSPDLGIRPKTQGGNSKQQLWIVNLKFGQCTDFRTGNCWQMLALERGGPVANAVGSNRLHPAEV